ncbi:MAG: ABC transporter ATP-binding protein [Desulfomonile tiedjei]|uniref:ABC transporter ATP-binding protein n=1 Tax=Desulfomonile tiedjei TaxID=2358 RepID=A0A9D6V2Z6_9BACT|nr:ABC transporter ATP-binding protein [Desulfomonile tiedjei]
MALLKVQDLGMRFGGLMANWGVSFEIASGEMVGLIGPNGAGKSTLFNCIAGLYNPTHGRIHFLDQDVTGRKPYEMARMGLARTFQVYVASGDLTVLENVMVGCFLKTRSRRLAKERAGELLSSMRLSHLSDRNMANLPVAAQKRVVMATALATEPKLLLLDEVAAGLNSTEIDEMIGLIRWVNTEMGISVILIEHVMELVMNLSQRVLVLDSGTLIAEGEPEEIVRKPEVIKAYLGERYLNEHSDASSKGEPVA